MGDGGRDADPRSGERDQGALPVHVNIQRMQETTRATTVFFGSYLGLLSTCDLASWTSFFGFYLCLSCSCRPLLDLSCSKLVYFCSMYDVTSYKASLGI